MIYFISIIDVLKVDILCQLRWVKSWLTDEDPTVMHHDYNAAEDPEGGGNDVTEEANIAVEFEIGVERCR